MSIQLRIRTWGVSAMVSCCLILCGLTACREKPAGKPAPPPADGANEPANVSEPAGVPAMPDKARRKGVDDKDDPRTPVCLPKSNQAGEWVKREPVRVADAKMLGRLVSEDEATRFALFSVKTAAQCAYALPRPGGGTLQAEVLLIETESSDDAYSLMTCRSHSPRTMPIGGETRVEQGDGLHLHCWQGRCYIHIWTPRQAADAEEATSQLLTYITAGIQREDGPELMEAMPRDQTILARRWFLRHLGCLSADALGLTPVPDLAKINTLLGLGKDTQMCIASYEVPEAHRPNVVWLVRYPTKQAADAAYARYSRQLKMDTGPGWDSTNLMRPHGLFLIGTWTAEEESLQYMMPRIKQLLPP